MREDTKKRPDGYDALPKRFKDYIRQMESEIDSLEKARPVKEPTRVKIADFSARHDNREEQHFPDNTRIGFALHGLGAAARWIDVRLTERWPRDGLMLEVSGENAIFIHPGVSNQIYVGMVKR